MTFEEAIIKKLQEDYKLLQMSCDGFKADRDRLASELVEAQRQVEFWRTTAERRGNEIKRLYILEAALKAELDEYDRDKEDKCDTPS